VINGSLLRPLPAVTEPHRLVTVDRVQPTVAVAEFSYPDYRDLRDHSTALAGLAAFNGTSMTLDDVAGTTRAWVGFVTYDFFTVLGVEPAAGRMFSLPDASAVGAEAQQIVVLGHALWQSRFGGSQSAIGTTLELDGEVFTIVGVAPPGFIGAMAVYPMELWIPVTSGGRLSAALAGGLDIDSRRQASLRLVGRLAPGRSVDDAQADLAAIAARLAETHPTNRGRGVQVMAGAGITTEERADISRVPRLLAMAVTLLLLIACANVAGLVLVRSAARRREIATRIALGASRGALVRQVVLEGVVIAVGAGLLGVLLARLLVRSATLVRTVIPMTDVDVAMDLRVLAVALAAAALTAILVSLLPAIQLFQVAPGAVLKDGGGAVRRRSGQRMLVAAQVAASIVLLAAAAIVFSAFHRVLTAHDDADPRGLTDVGLSIRESIPDAAARVAFFRAVLARAAADPDIAGAALTSTIPPFQWSMRTSVFRRGEEPPPAVLAGRELELGLRVMAVSVSGSFFDVMRIPLVRGRMFSTRDDERAAPVAIVSRAVADELWPGQDPVGRMLAWPAVEGPPRAPLRVVGVAADTRGLAPTAPPPLTIYLPFTQHPGVHILVARGRAHQPVAENTLRRIIADVNASVDVVGGRTLFDRLQQEARPQLTASAWIGVFGAIALLLAAIGLYGVVAQNVLQRTRELAVRSALGATPIGILTTVLGDGMRLTALGGIAGALGAIAAFRLLRSLFTGVHAVDVLPVAVAVAVLAIALLAATYLPARRAARLQPLDALRSD
ncbi:MAG: ADOP family duplicated permease, partial [Longimicrobiales bacterium]